MRLSPAIKRRMANGTEHKPPDFEHVLPTALSAIRQFIDEDVEIYEVYIALKNDGAILSYDFKELD